MKVHICDLCKKHIPTTKIKYKYRAKKHWVLFYEEGWNRIEICDTCLTHIIQASREDINEQ